MKFLLLLVLVGYVAANSGWERTLDGQVSDLFEDDSFLREYRAEGDDVQTELGKKLRETLDHLLEKVKESVERGKTVKKEVIEKLKETREKMRELGVSIGDKSKELLQKIKDRAKNFLKDLLERLGLKDDKDAVRRALGWERTLDGQVSDLFEDDSFLREYRAEGDDVQTELGKKLRETLDHLLEKVKESVERGKTVKKEVIEKLKETREKMRELGVSIGDKSKELLQKIKDRAKNFLKNLLERLGLKDDKDAVRRALVFEMEVSELIRRAEGNDVTTEMGKKLKEALDHIMQKIKDSVDQGKTVKQDVIDRLKDIREKMKEMRIDMGEKAKELLNKIKEKAKDFLRDLLDKLGLKDKRSVALAESKIRGMFRKLKKALLGAIDKEKVKEMIEKFFGKGNEMADSLLNLLKGKGGAGKQKILDFIDKVLGEDEVRETRAIQDLWDKVKNFFKDLKIDLNEKFLKFGDWVKENTRLVVDKSKSKVENIKSIAQEFVKNAKNTRKDIAVEALEFLKPYKQDLGNLWDQVKDTVKSVLNRKD